VFTNLLYINKRISEVIIGIYKLKVDQLNPFLKKTSFFLVSFAAVLSVTESGHFPKMIDFAKLGINFAVKF
jgi:hypothetical protein